MLVLDVLVEPKLGRARQVEALGVSMVASLRSVAAELL
jgi:hypothetical protein